MGLSVGIGHAIAAKKKNLTSRSYVLMGDGECNEGSVWEAIMAAKHFKLDNLTAIVDRNGGSKLVRVLILWMLVIYLRNLDSFGWHAVDIDGHDTADIYMALNEENKGMPKAIIAKTIKGKGFPFSEENNSWHHAVLTEKLYNLGLR